MGVGWSRPFQAIFANLRPEYRTFLLSLRQALERPRAM